MAAIVNLNINYGASWVFQATFPIELDLSGALVDVEVLPAADSPSSEALLKFSTANKINITGQVVSFNITSKLLINSLLPNDYYWRLFIKYANGIRDNVMSGNFIFRDSV